MHLCFRICKILGFSYHGSYLLIGLCTIVHTGFHQTVTMMFYNVILSYIIVSAVCNDFYGKHKFWIFFK